MRFSANLNIIIKAIEKASNHISRDFVELENLQSNPASASKFTSASYNRVKQVLIEDFFAKHKVKSYKTAHTSVVNGDQQFITGSLDTSHGKFRISILVRGNLISQFRIENDNG